MRDFEKHEQQKKNDALRRAGHKLAEFIGQCVKRTDTGRHKKFMILRR